MNESDFWFEGVQDPTNPDFFWIEGIPTKKRVDAIPPQECRMHHKAYEECYMEHPII